MKNIIIALLFLFGITTPLISQCDFAVNSGGFEYTVDVDLSVSNVIYTQAGTTCNVNIEVAYDVQINVVNAPSWWDENLWVLQGNFNCVGGSGSSFFNLPNGGGTGTVTSATFSYPSTDCANVVIDCPITLSIQGPGGLNYNGPCGAIQESSLPVLISEFYQELDADQNIDLFWSTQTEINFSHFEIESSFDKYAWDLEELVPGLNASYGAAYRYKLDQNAQDRYLRLKMVDLDGSFEYSNTLFIPKRIKDEPVLFPNPVSDLVQVSGVTASEVHVYNIFGQRMKVAQIENGFVDLSGLHAGHYNMHFVENNRAATSLRFVKL